jgi:hypothetical protein
VSQTVAGNSRGASSSANTFGRLVSTSRNGKLQTFVRDLGNGELEVSFVIWA